VCGLSTAALRATRAPPGSARGVEASLPALDTEIIDLYQAHWPDPRTPFEETATALATLGHVGVSNFDVGQMARFGSVLQVETLQPPYSLFQRGIEAEVIPYTEVNGIGVLVY